MGLLYHPYLFKLVSAFLASLFNFLNYCIWLRITDEGLVPELRIWSILLIRSDLKCCIPLSRSIFYNFNYLVSVTASGPESPRARAHVPKSYGRLRLIRSVSRISKFSVLELTEIVILWVYYTIPFGSLFRYFWHHFSTFKLLYLAKDHWRWLSTRNAHLVHIVNLIRFKMVYTS